MPLVCPECLTEIDPALAATCPTCGHGFSSGPDDETAGYAVASHDRTAPASAQFGRYRTIGKQGAGGFGVVFRAFDEELRRDVAVKVPHRHRLESRQAVETYLAEARAVARLDHPAIVPVYDVGQTADDRCYLVSKFIDGSNLSERLRLSRLSHVQSAQIVLRVASALHHAHQRGLIHRDVKPSNILLDRAENPYLTDFGLALGEEDIAHAGHIAGTPAYMSPEQLRRETHRIDARTDVYSLGAVLYELLAGSWPLHGKTVPELREQIMRFELPPLRTVDATVPKELERICHKALMKRCTDRYSTAIDLAEDLEQCLPALAAADASPATPHAGAGSAVATNTQLPGSVPGSSANPNSSATGSTVAGVGSTSLGLDEPIRVVPKGLRSFDPEDADFFLELLPGPFDREGLPESVRFWKNRIEQTDPDKTFDVGLIYGPSGCGKSSLVKAGILPRLAEHVVRIYLEATPEGTEARLLRALRKHVPLIPVELSLKDTLAAIRRGVGLAAGRKVLVVLDQFEQWLHAHRESEGPELLRTLRQCDGGRLQCVVMVRDDFWMAITRFMHELETKLVQGHNSAGVDLFSPQHARKVLAAFGRAFGCLPPTDEGLSADHKAFLREAVRGLTRDGKVISVRIALLADMLKNKPWSPATLKKVGGTEGIGLTFLEETFSASHAPPQHRVHQRAARKVLGALLPETGSDIKGQMHARDALLACSGYANRPGDFDELIHILDAELRLVTPTDPEGTLDGADPLSQDSAPRAAPAGRYYQLTHDYLVPSVRRWLVHKQRQTRRGRAELLLEERSATWNARPHRRYLPSWWQWHRIKLFTRKRDWSQRHRKMMRAAAWYHQSRTVAIAVVLMLLGWGGLEGMGYLRAQKLRDQVLYVKTADLPGIIPQFMPYRRWADPLLRRALEGAVPRSREELNLRLALLPNDPDQVEALYGRLLQCDLQVFFVLRNALFEYRDTFSQRLWDLLDNVSSDANHRLRAAMLLARYSPPQNEEFAARWEKHAHFVAQQLHTTVVADPVQYNALTAALTPVRGLLLDPLHSICRDARLSDSDRSIATNLVLEYATDRPDLLADILLSDDNTNRATRIVDRLTATPAEAVALLQPELARRQEELEPQWNDPPAGTFQPPDPALVQEIEAATGMLGEHFAFCQSMPLDEFVALAEALRGAGYRPVRFRPFAGGDGIRVAAVWTRDERTWSIDHGLTQEEVRKQISGDRMKDDLLHDMAAYRDDAGELRYTTTWSTRQPDDPEAIAFAGEEGQEWLSFINNDASGFSFITNQLLPTETGSLYYTFVFWKTNQVDRTWINHHPKAYAELVRENYAEHLLVDANATALSTTSPAQARRAQYVAAVADADSAVRADPGQLRNWYDRGFANFRATNDADAIQDFTHYLENGGNEDEQSWRPEHAHKWRIAAAARLGVEQAQIDEYVRQADAFHDSDRYFALFHRALAASHGPRVQEAIAGFEQHIAELGEDVWRHFFLVRAYAFASAALRGRDAARSQLYAERAIAHLHQTVSSDTRHVFWVRTYPLTDSLRDDPRFRQIELEVELKDIESVRLARDGNAEGARASLRTFLRGSANLQQKARRAAMTAAFLGDDEAGMRQLESELAGRPNHQALRFNAAYAYSVASHAVAEAHPERAARYADRAVELLSQWTRDASFTALGSRLRRILTNWHYHPLRKHPGFKELVKELDRSYTGVFHRNVDFESQEVRRRDPAKYLERCRELAAKGYRVVAADTAAIPAPDDRAGRFDAVSVWHKPRVTEEQRDELARRQATSAVALARLGQEEQVRPLLKHNPEPRLRTFLLHQLSRLGSDPDSLIARLQEEPDASVRSALILALGGFDEDAIPPPERQTLAAQLVQTYLSDADPAVHSAGEWLLRKWGYADELAESDARLATARPETGRRWFVTPGGHTMVVIDGPVELEMGSPVREPARDTDETPHLRRISRSFAIATKEVTVEQFQRFLLANPQVEHSYRRAHSPELDCPVGSVTWYQMAQYCRWLSEREGLPEEEMCYPPIDEIKPGMRLKPFYLTRAGYRLPTEAEWEYACRAGTTTARYYGYSEALLPKYGWFEKVAENRSWPVGTLLPNDFGLFDMYGNAMELCHEHLDYPDDAEAQTLEDAIPTAYETTPVRLSLRGGSALNDARWLRSADRYNRGTSVLGAGQRHFGFRLVRTLPPGNVLAARVHAAEARRLRESAETTELEKAFGLAAASYDKLVAAHPDEDVHVWDLAQLLLDRAAHWTLLEPTELTASGGATLELQSDGSILASGVNPDDDSYTILAQTDVDGIRAIRLEALPDSSHPNGAIGRFPSNGNFHLSEFSLALRGRESDDEAPVSIRRAFADYALVDFDVRRALDGNQVTFWDLVPQQRQPHVAVFETAQPVGGSDAATLVIKLDFTTRRWDQHNLGRFRLWVTNDPATVQAERIRMSLDEVHSRLAAASYLVGDAQRGLDCLTRQQTAPSLPLVIEAEHFDVIEAPWRIYSDPMASGGRYLMAPNGTGGGSGTDKQLHYRFHLPSAGEFHLVARAHGPNGTDDSLWLSIDGSTPVFWGINGARSGWNWVDHPDSFTLSAGEHTLHIGVREDGTRLDKILVTADASFDPRRTDVGPTVYDPLLLSLACSYLGRHDEALDHLEQSLDWMQKHRTDAAIEHLADEALAAVVAHEPDNATWLGRRAAMAARRGEHEQAIDAYAKLAQSEPANPEWSLRLRQLQPDVAAFWNFDFGYDDWRPGNQCRLSLAEGSLRVQSTGTDPHVAVTTAAPAGWYELAIRFRSDELMPVQVFWGTRWDPTFVDHQSVSTTLEGSSDDWTVQRAYFRSTEPLTFLRLDLGDRADASIEIDAITLRLLGDEPEQVLAALNTIIEAEPEYAGALFRRAALYAAMNRRDEAYDDYANGLVASAPNAAVLAAVEQSVGQRPLTATSEKEPGHWRYTFTDPGEGWLDLEFADDHWKTGPAPFGDWQTFETRWDTSDIWLRREFELDQLPDSPALFVSALVDERAQVYVNGVLAAEGIWTGSATYQRLDCAVAAVAALQSGRNVLAVRCSNEVGAALIDAGLYQDTREVLLDVLDKALAVAPDRDDLRVARGDLHTSAQSWAEAAEDYSKAITGETQDAELIAKRAEAYYQLRQWEPSVADWTRALELTPDVVEYLRKRAFCYRNLRQRGKARADWTRLTKLRPGNAWFRLQLAFSFNRSRQWDKALADHNEAITIAADNQPWHFRFHRGGHWAQRGRWDEAAADFRYVQDNAPDDYFEGVNWWVGRDLAMVFAITGEHDRFERAADRLVGTFADTDNAEIADWIVKACVMRPVDEGRAGVLTALEQRSNHFADLQSALKWHAGAFAEADALLAGQNHPAAQFLRALIQQGLGDTQAAIGSFESGQRETVAEEAAADTRNPFGFWQQWAFTRALRQHAKTQVLDRRLADLNEALATDPEDAKLLCARGLAYKALARDAEALADLDQALTRDADLHEAWFHRGQLKAALGQSADALSDFSKAIELHTERPEYFVARGDLYAQAEAWKEAAADYSQVITPDSEDVALIVKRADAYEKLEQWQDAVGDWTRALELRPNNVGYRTRRARCYSWRLANHEKAIEDWTRLIELRETDPWAFMERGNSNNSLGRWDKAMADYDRAVAIGTDDTWWWSYLLRGSHWARHGEWQKAADDLARSFPLPPQDWGAWQVAREHALLRMMVDDLQGYRQAAEVLQQRTPDDLNVVQLRWLIYVLILDPDGIDRAERDRLTALVDRLATGANARWAPRLKAAILFRTGAVEEAVRLFEESSDGPELQFLAAMAYQKLGQPDRAKELFNEAAASIRQGLDNPGNALSQGGVEWQDWAVYLVLHRQAEAIINAGDQRADGTDNTDAR